MVLLFLYCVMGMISASFYCGTSLTVFITIYFLIAYQKKYMYKLSNSLLFNRVMLLLGLVGTIILVLLTNFLGHYVTFLENQMLHWSRSCNPFIIMIALSLFNIARQKTFVSRSINYISSLSMLIYIIHENILVRTYLQRWIWYEIFSNYGYNYIVLWAILFSIVLMILAVAISGIYRGTVQKVTNHIADFIYENAKKMFDHISKAIMSIK